MPTLYKYAVAAGFPEHASEQRARPRCMLCSHFRFPTLAWVLQPRLLACACAAVAQALHTCTHVCTRGAQVAPNSGRKPAGPRPKPGEETHLRDDEEPLEERSKGEHHHNRPD
eukprot:7380392-Prymnesium_polylepis.1